MNDIIIVDLPPTTEHIQGCWSQGYPVHQGETEESLNYATLYSQQHNIRPDQERLKKEHADFVQLLTSAGLTVHQLPFPQHLNVPGSVHHDAVFVRDAGMIIDDLWIEARFSVKERMPELEAHTAAMVEKFGLKRVQLPEDAFLEFGEVFYLQTPSKTYYFGGLGRSNRAGHAAVIEMLKPDVAVLVESEGYHLDTVFAPVLSADNELKALLLARGMVYPQSITELEELGVELVYVDPIDSSGEGEELGNYAINGLVLPGLFFSASLFETEGLEERFSQWGAVHHVSPLTDFRYAGGSYHCLTNEVYTSGEKLLTPLRKSDTITEA